MEDDEGNIFCDHCKKEIPEEKDYYECDECGDENICENCMMMKLENISLCKKCVDEAYPRKIETKIEYQEKFIEKPVKIFVDKEGTPIDNKFNPLQKTKFD